VQDAALRKGAEVVVHWGMSEGQEITAEVELPDVGQRFDRRKYYNWQLARQNFSGEDGAKPGACLGRLGKCRRRCTTSIFRASAKATRTLGQPNGSHPRDR
jgi:hypothetical protein